MSIFAVVWTCWHGRAGRRDRENPGSITPC